METQAKLRLLTVVYIEGLDSPKERAKPGVAKRMAATVIRRCSAGVGLEWCERWAYPASELSHVAASARTAPKVEAQAPEPPSSPAPGGEPCVYRLEFID